MTNFKTTFGFLNLITTRTTSTHPSRPLLSWLDWDMMWAYFLCLKIQLEFRQQLKLPRNAAEGDRPRTTPQLEFSKAFIVVRGGLSGFK